VDADAARRSVVTYIQVKKETTPGNTFVGTFGRTQLCPEGPPNTPLGS
jgi:hypothetical protein